jgi:hypothetical protein
MSTSIWVRGSGIDPHLIFKRVMVLTTLQTAPFTLLNRMLTSTHLSILVTVLREGWARLGLGGVNVEAGEQANPMSATYQTVDSRLLFQM